MGSSNMDAVFKEFEKAGKTDVDNLMQWMKDSKIIETANDERVRKMFRDNSQVELTKFKSVLAKIAQEQSKSVDQLSKQLVSTAPKFIDAAIAGLQAFKEALKNTK